LQFFSPPASLDAEFAERKYVFFSGERPEKKRSYSVMAAKMAEIHMKTPL